MSCDDRFLTSACRPVSGSILSTKRPMFCRVLMAVLTRLADPNLGISFSISAGSFMSTILVFEKTSFRSYMANIMLVSDTPVIDARNGISFSASTLNPNGVLDTILHV